MQKMQIFVHRHAHLVFGSYLFLILHRANVKPYGENAVLWYSFAVILLIFSYFVFVNGAAFGIRKTIENIDSIKKEFLEEIDSNK